MLWYWYISLGKFNIRNQSGRSFPLAPKNYKKNTMNKNKKVKQKRIIKYPSSDKIKMQKANK